MSDKLPLAQVKFLVIDNSEHMREIVCAVLRSLGGRQIREANSSTNGLKLYQSYYPDVIFMESVLTPISGLEVTRTIRNDTLGPNPFVPIIMMSPPTTKDEVLAARDAGVTEFLAKPFTANAILAILSEIVYNPRPFIKAKQFVGPDRRRRNEAVDREQARRQSDMLDDDTGTWS